MKLLERHLADSQKFADRLKAINDRQVEIEATVEADHDGQFTNELQAEYDSLNSEYDETLKKKKASDKAAQDIRNRADRSSDDWSVNPPMPRRSGDSGGPAPQPSNDSGQKFKMHATVKRSRVKNFVGDRNGFTPEQRSYAFGMWGLSAISQCIPRYNFPEAEAFVRDHASFFNVLQTNGANGGQYLVPEQFGTDMIVLREMYGVSRRLLQIRQMTSDTRTDPRRVSGLTAYFVGEGNAGTESDVSKDNVRLVAKDLMVLSRYSSQLDQDAVISIGDDLAGEISYAFANKEDECTFNGDGTSTYGGITGFRTKLQDIDGAGTDSFGLQTQGTGNTWGAIVLGDFSSVVAALPQYADTPNASWVMHRTFFYDVCEPLVLASGGTTAMEQRDGERRPRPMFKGYPVDFSQVMPNSTATSSVVCTLGDHALAASLGDRQQESIDFSEHASIGGESVFERNQIAIRGCERLDINVHSVGSATEAGPVVGLQTGS